MCRRLADFTNRIFFKRLKGYSQNFEVYLNLLLTTSYITIQ